MVFKLFKKKRLEVDKKFSDLNDSLKNSFSKIKEDVFSLSSHVETLHDHKKNHGELIDELDSRLKLLENFIGETLTGHALVQTEDLSKQTQTVVRSKRTSLHVQTEILESLKRLTPMERSLVWALLNTDLRLSYSDLGRILGKDESTVRGQVSNIKRKTEGLVLEKSESNGQKRFYIEERIKNKIMKKYRVKNKK